MATFRYYNLVLAYGFVAALAAPSKADDLMPSLSAHDRYMQTQSRYDQVAPMPTQQQAYARTYNPAPAYRGVAATAAAAPTQYHPQPVAYASDNTSSGSSLKTQEGLGVGFQFSDYKYQEPDLDMRIKGFKYGFTLDATKVLNDDWFVRAESRFAIGFDNYHSPSGFQKGVESDIFELRALAGHDFIFGSYSLSPYAGLGWRFLSNDLKGTTDLGSPGYLRESNYLYFPIGVKPRIKLDNSSRLSMGIEYDQLIYGWQYSQLSDASSSLPDLHNHQRGGYGLRGEVMYEHAKWSFGPYFQYWNIDQSDNTCPPAGCGWEPHNQTLEYGLQGHYLFTSVW